ncbi:MAG: type 1 glutamine amidotransferase [Acidimicrobiales bacterium]|nr:type 1 glutamine amidotransferase [Acidimicrobiales bacterium]
MSSNPRALVFAHEPDGPASQVEVRLRQRGYEVDTHFVTLDYDKPDAAEPFPDIAGYDMLVVMGSVRSLTRKDEIGSWIHRELELVRQSHDSGTPVLGVCFGGQIIADAFGGRVEEMPSAAIGWFEIEAVEGSNPIGPGPWFEWHHDRFIPPAGVEVLAQNANSVQLIRLGRTLGTQFHPEVDHDHMTGFLAMASDEYMAENGLDHDAMIADMLQHEQRNIEQCHALVDWFVDEVASSDFVPRPNAT